MTADKAKSAAELGGMDALIAAAKAEGELNVITLPRDWCNYGEMMDTFSKKYGIKVNSLNPDGGSAFNRCSKPIGRATSSRLSFIPATPTSTLRTSTNGSMPRAV
jgi:hypothetical protein